MSLTIVVERPDLSVRLRNTANGPTPAIGAFSILVDEVSEVEYVVHGVLSRRVPKGVKEAEVVVRAGKDG